MFKNSPKIFDGCKSDFPENTIKRISSGFRKIGLDVFYKPHYEPRPASRIQSGSAFIANTEFSTNGKGTSPVLSEASALAEMAERYSSTWNLCFLGSADLSSTFGKKSLFWDLFERHRTMYRNFNRRDFLKGYEYRGEVKTSEFLRELYPFTPEELSLLHDRDVLQHWADSYSLLEERTVKIPPMLFDILSGSNGLASGNTLEEAFVQAMMEVFERHALFSAFLSQRSCPTVDPRTIDDAEIQHYIALFKSLHIDSIIKDFSLGGQVPVVGVIFVNRNIENDANVLKRTYYYRTLSVGAHFNRVEALKRCFTEGVQGYSLEEFQYRRRLDPLWRFWHDRMGKTIQEPAHPLYLLFTNCNYAGDMDFLDQNTPVIRFEDLTDIRHGDFIDDIGEIASLCRDNGWKPYVIDYTHPVLGFSTVRVVVPPISYIERCRVRDFSICNQFSPEGGMRVLGMDIPRGWFPTRDDVVRLIDAVESYVSMYPTHHTTLSALRVLSVAHLLLGDVGEAGRYSDFLEKNVWDTDAVGAVKSHIEKHEAPPLELIRKALFGDCECVDCLVRFPRAIHRMVASFYDAGKLPR